METEWNKLPRYFYENKDQIFVKRNEKDPNGSMITNKLVSSVDSQSKYVLTPEGPKRTYEVSYDPPKYAIIKGDWIKAKKGDYTSNNILGQDGEFLTTLNSLSIPVTKTTKANLKWYGCKLISPTEEFKFDTNTQLPVADMSIGKEYISNYLLREDVGFYLEYHDQPHLHMPKNKYSSGHLILGRYILNDTIALSAFEIPFGYAIYTPPFIIHDDGMLVGDYYVVYSITENYSTVIVKNKDTKKPINVTII